MEFWEATEERCKFRVQGFDVQLRFEEREPHHRIKLVPEGDSLPFPFAFWIQIKETAPYDTRLRVVLDIELNMMMRMMVGSKLQSATDKIAEQIATALR
ncbi:hypothetical protein BN938_2568 [Mucinivorans hirudinis]|uniref:Polyketide cyclase n=1 Tax=Mucinivorans hirudinis TaxID=1433126 RepID=A0A060RDZ3_9BACT|nr:hypothetical protein BN938_2568 [Mucinivorans hirudinis]